MARDPNDAWVECRCGARHWGLAGAAGLCLVDPASGTVALQLRSARSHQGGTWALPGGAIQVGESSVQAALRESAEEAAIPAESVRPWVTYRLDHTDWAYTTVVATVVGPRPDLAPLDGESADLRWVGLEAVASHDLHPAFAAAWPMLRGLIPLRPALLIDAANVVGSRPDGWWRDRAGATTKVLEDLAAALESGVPGEWFDDRAHRAWPTTTVVLEGEARAASAPEVPDLLAIRRAPRSGDDEIALAAGDLLARGAEPLLMATADRGLIARVPGARILGPGTLRRAIDHPD